MANDYDAGNAPSSIENHISRVFVIAILMNAPGLTIGIASMGDRFNSGWFAFMATLFINIFVAGFVALRERPSDFWKGYFLAVVLTLLIMPAICQVGL